MFQAHQYIHTIQTLERGVPRMEVMANAIAEADREDAHHWRLYFRYRYIQESVFHDDNFKAILMFPEFLAIYDEHEELHDEFERDMMFAFKWILENATDYYQVDRSQIAAYFAEFKKRCETLGYSLRAYYMKKSRYYLAVDREVSQDAIRKFRACKRDSVSDCEACEMHYDMSMALEFGEEADALRIAQPLFEGKKTCGEVPHVTYGALTKYYLYHQNWKEASYYARLCERYTKNKPEFLEETAYLLELYSVLHPQTGWQIFKQNIGHFLACKNPMMRMHFARGAWRLLAQVEKETAYSQNPLLADLPVEKHPEGIPIAACKDYFYQFAVEQAKRLDDRNGTRYFMEFIETTFPEDLAEMGDMAEQDTLHGIVKKVPAVIALASAAALPTLEELEQRLAADGTLDLLSHEVDDGILYCSIRVQEHVYDVVTVIEETGFAARPAAGLADADLQTLTENGQKLLLQMEYGDAPLYDLHLLMRLSMILLPNLIGAVNVHTVRAYPASKVQFMAEHENAVMPRDLLDLNICGEEESDALWMQTMGLCCLGLRELELWGADRENFPSYADLLCHAGCQCVEANMLPDAGVEFGSFQVIGQDIGFSWKSPVELLHDHPEYTLAAKIQRPIESGVLHVKAMDQDLLPTKFRPLQAGMDMGFGRSHMILERTVHLAKETISHLERLLAQPMDCAAMRLELELTEEMREEYGYRYELLWAEFDRMEGGTIYAKLVEQSDAVPAYQEGDCIAVTVENIADWFVDRDGSRLSPRDAYLA